MHDTTPSHKKLERRIEFFILLVILSGIVVSCRDSDHDTSFNNGISGQNNTSISRFMKSVNDCRDLERSLKNQMIQRNGDKIQDNLEYALQMLESEYCWYGCVGVDVICPTETDYDVDNPNRDTAPNSSGDRSQEAEEYSTTNNQVAGVDEADFIKNDGSYIYLLSGDQFLILRAWPPEDTAVLSSTVIEGRPTNLLVEDGKAVIYASTGEAPCCDDNKDLGYGSQSDGLTISVYDISNLLAPVLKRQVVLAGSYVSARRIGNSVHTVVTFPGTFEIDLKAWPEELPRYFCRQDVNAPTEEELRAKFEQLRLDNIQEIEDADLGDLLPSAKNIVYSGGTVQETEELFLGCENFYEPEASSTPGYLSVVTLLMDDQDVLAAATIAGRAGDVYVSGKNLYVGIKEYIHIEDPYTYDGSGERTIIHKFGLDNSGEAPKYKTSGRLPGRLINQFAMDEYQDRLRLATTEGYIFNSANHIFILEDGLTQETDDVDCENIGTTDCLQSASVPELVVAGAIRNIAPGEDIRAVRFDGDRGFMVTFKKTDPLFAFDLSDPYTPEVTGELEIPGFSTYMHFMDDNHLLTIGFDADDEGSFAWFTGVMLQIFDVSAMSAPALVHKEIIGTRGTTSDAINDHLAFNYFKSKDLLAIPMGICEDSSGGGSYGSRMTFNGLLVYHVTLKEGFTLLGGVDHSNESGDKGPYNDHNTSQDCYNWWQNPDSQVKRSVFMDNYVFSISPEKLKANELEDLSTDLVSIDLPQ